MRFVSFLLSSWCYWKEEDTTTLVLAFFSRALLVKGDLIVLIDFHE